MKSERAVFPMVVLVVKALAVVGGGLLTLLSLMSVIGAVTANGLARLGVAAVVTLALPALVVDRVLPKKDATKAPGLATDVLALTLLGFAFVYCGVAQPLTKKLLVAEGDRLAESGFGAPARVAYLFGGAIPEFPRETPSSAKADEADAGAPSSAGSDSSTSTD